MNATMKYTLPLYNFPTLYPSVFSAAVNLVVLRTKGPDSLSSPPDLEVPDLLQFGLEILTVVGVRVVLKRAGGLLSSLDGVIEVVKDGFESVLEPAGPVNGTTAGSGRACIEHPIHAVLLHSIKSVFSLFCLVSQLGRLTLPIRG